jgi:hypothetical protein
MTCAPVVKFHTEEARVAGPVALCIDASFDPAKLSFRDFRTRVVGERPEPKSGSILATLRRFLETVHSCQQLSVAAPHAVVPSLPSECVLSDCSG